MNHYNNICFCKCHEGGKPRCTKCRSFHIGKDKPATHVNDKENPDIAVGSPKE